VACSDNNTDKQHNINGNKTQTHAEITLLPYSTTTSEQGLEQ